MTKQKKCEPCQGSGELEYTVTNHGERNETVRDKCRYCNGTGRVAVTQESLARHD